MVVLLLRATSKLLAQWQVPHEVVKKMDKANYVINMKDKRKR